MKQSIEITHRDGKVDRHINVSVKVLENIILIIQPHRLLSYNGKWFVENMVRL